MHRDAETPDERQKQSAGAAAKRVGDTDRDAETRDAQTLAERSEMKEKLRAETQRHRESGSSRAQAQCDGETAMPIQTSTARQRDCLMSAWCFAQRADGARCAHIVE